jgi:hypothetical protein
MRTKLACPVVPAIEICPNCKSEMIVAQVTPTFLADGFEDVIYRCKGCQSDVKRMFQTKFGRVGTSYGGSHLRCGLMRSKLFATVPSTEFFFCRERRLLLVS